MQIRAHRAQAAVAALLLLAGVAGAAAAGSALPSKGTLLGGDFRISGSGAQAMSPAVAWNGTDNEYLVVWEDWRDPDTRGADIYGRRLSPAGVPSANSFRISTATADDTLPAVAWNSAGNEYLVVWYDGVGIRGRRVSAAGVPQGGDFVVDGAGALPAVDRPAVAWNDLDRNYLIAWIDARNDATRGLDVYGRRVSAGGVPQGGDFRISGTQAKYDEWEPALAWNGTDGYLVVWSDFRSLPSRGADVYGRRVSAGGMPLADDFLIGGPNATANDLSPALAWSGARRDYLVVWRDARSMASRGYDIYGRLVSKAGAVPGGDFSISGPGAARNEYEAAAVWNSTAGKYFVVWDDERNEAARGRDIYSRRVSGAGAPLGGDLRISGPKATEDERGPALAWNATANEYLAVWGDSRRASAGHWDVYGRLLSG